jgi:hypothetical protein
MAYLHEGDDKGRVRPGRPLIHCRGGEMLAVLAHPENLGMGGDSKQKKKKKKEFGFILFNHMPVPTVFMLSLVIYFLIYL